MNKVVALIPCYMKDNTRSKNISCLTRFRDTFDFDCFTVYDQGFKESDYLEGFNYIGHQPTGVGFVEPRNSLLKWFYESDYDYAFWIDANSTISKPTCNDVHTLLSFAKENGLGDIDAVFSTLGIINDAERIKLKQGLFYKSRLTLIPAKYDSKSNWFHGLMMKNFNKFYGETPYINPKFDPRVNGGLCEDVYFSRLLRKLYNCYHAPTIIINKPNSNFSTHKADGSGKYNYPTILYGETDTAINEDSKKFPVRNYFNRSNIEIPRVEKDIEYMAEYKSRSKALPPASSLFM